MSQPENETPVRSTSDRSKLPALPEELTIPPMTYGSWMELGLAARQMATAAAPMEAPPSRPRRPRAPRAA